MFRVDSYLQFIFISLFKILNKCHLQKSKYENQALVSQDAYMLSLWKVSIHDNQNKLKIKQEITTLLIRITYYYWLVIKKNSV